MNGVVRLDKREYCEKLLKHYGAQAYGASTLRGQPKKTRAVIKKFIECKLVAGQRVIQALSRCDNENGFAAQLNRWANKLQKTLESELPYKEDEAFGISRKSLNIYLRVILNDKYLYSQNKALFKRLLPYLDLPLDSRTMKALREYSSNKIREGLRTTIKALTPKSYKRYQEIAKMRAKAVLPSGVQYKANLDYVDWGSGDEPE